jgi:uncharacterized membrane protein
VGRNSESGIEAFRWEDGVMTGLGDLPGGGFQSQARAVSGDGSTIVGLASVSDHFEAMIWTEATGMRAISDLLVNVYGLDLTGWTLRYAQGISEDGLTIVGYGTNPNGDTEGWIAEDPPYHPSNWITFGAGSTFLVIPRT